VIEVRDLTKRFGDTVAVDRLTFSVQPGMVTGFLGPNGAGKTTTMRVILGLDHPTSGAATINGHSYRNSPAPMYEVGALLEAKAVHGGRSARKHLTWLAQAGGVPVSRVDEVLDMVGLTQVAGRKIGGFSLGMSQRLGIATAMLGDPDVLLFDEPVNGLDPEGIRWVRTMMRKLASEGRTVLVSSHLMSEMEETAEHVIVIGRGKLIADASMSDFMLQSASSHVRVISPQASDLVLLLERAGATVSQADDGVLLVTGIEAPAIGDLAADNGIRLHELSPRRASLETAFMELTSGSVDYRSGQDPHDAAMSRELQEQESR
jgi:ABC-2 type transport system ATP-binding protein